MTPFQQGFVADRHRLPVLPPSFSCTLWIMLVPVSPTMPRTPRPVGIVSSMAGLMSTRRLLLPMVSLVSTGGSVPQSSVSSSIVDCTLECTTRSSLFFSSVLSKVAFWPHSCSAGPSPLVLVSPRTLSILSVGA